MNKVNIAKGVGRLIQRQNNIKNNGIIATNSGDDELCDLFIYYIVYCKL
jgi:hypothetical protein